MRGLVAFYDIRPIRCIEFFAGIWDVMLQGSFQRPSLMTSMLHNLEAERTAGS